MPAQYGIKDEVIDWLLWYDQNDQKRLHSTLACASPMRFEQDWRTAQAGQFATS